MVKADAFAASDMASAMYIVFPVLKKYNTQDLMSLYFLLIHFIRSSGSLT
jgi:hypothetical protein